MARACRALACAEGSGGTPRADTASGCTQVARSSNCCQPSPAASQASASASRSSTGMRSW